MSGVWRGALAQAQADLISRLRAPASTVAALSVLAAAYVWLPHEGQLASISWRLADGRSQAPLFDGAYVGAAAAILGGIFSVFVAFPLVAGSIRSDRSSGVGALVAAAHISTGGYLLGRFASNLAYLLLLGSLILAGGLLRLVCFGVGAVSVSQLLLPFLLFNVPALAIVAACAVGFDATPGLRGRAAPLLWFCFATFLLLAFPLESSRAHPGLIPSFDPLGVGTSTTAIERSAVPTGAHGFSTGLVHHTRPLERVAWPGMALAADVLWARLLATLWCLPPLAVALLMFDRFDPARGTSRRPPRRAPAVTVAAVTGGATRLADLPPARPVPTLLASALAEAILVWQAASWLRWPLVVAAVWAAAMPGGKAGPAAFLLLLALVVSEAAARDALSGTRALIIAQPGVPRDPVLWRAAALVGFALTLGVLPILGMLVLSAAHALALLLGLVFLAGFASAAGSLTGGGRLFSSVVILLLYGALSGGTGLDFAGACGEPSVTRSAAYVGASLLLLVVAGLAERRRERG